MPYNSVKEIVEGMQQTNRSLAFIRMNVARFMVMRDEEYMKKVDAAIARHSHEKKCVTEPSTLKNAVFYKAAKCTGQLRRSNNENKDIYYSNGTRWVKLTRKKDLDYYGAMTAGQLKKAKYEKQV